MSKALLLISESWNGKRPLYKVFWIYYVLFFFPIIVLLLLFLQLGTLLPAPLGLVAILGAVLFLLLWKIWALVAIWRCAPNSSAPGYKFLARGFVILFILSAALEAPEKYESYRQRGLDSIAKSELKNAATAEEAFFVENSAYTNDVSALHHFGLKPNRDVRIVVLPGKGGFKKDYVVVSRHVNSEKTFVFNSHDGELTEVAVSELRQAGVKGIDQ